MRKSRIALLFASMTIAATVALFATRLLSVSAAIETQPKTLSSASDDRPDTDPITRAQKKSSEPVVTRTGTPTTTRTASAVFTGTTVGGPEWTRPFADGTCCSGLGPVRYHVFQFSVATTGSYDLNSIQDGWDGYIFVYANNFDPLNQSANFVAGDDDGNGGIGTSDLEGLTLTAGTCYTFVTTGFENGEEGTWTATITGPGTISNGCSVPPTVSSSITDPAVCLGPGGVVSVSASVTNNNTTAQASTFTATLPAALLALPGTCTVNVGTCTVTASSVTWAGTLNAGQALTITYQAQIADGTPNGTQVCVVSSATVSADTVAVTACTTLNCPVVGPGALPNGQNAVSDQKPGSVLVYPIYSSSAANGSTQNTRIAITNTNVSRNALVHLFFVDGSSCSVADSYICLTPNQTATVLASDIDPGTTGYLVAIAVNAAGCPINFNHLIGDEFVKLASGHQSNLGAESIAAIAGGLPACNPLTDSNAVLSFNNVSYNALPRVLASSNIPSRGDGNDTYVVINRIGGNLSTAGAAIGGFFGILYDDSEAAYSFSLAASACQSAGSITNDRPRTVPRIETVIPSGRSGWFKIWGASDIGILGAQINRNNNAGTNASAFNHGHNLHKLTYTTTATVTIPVFPPSC